MSIFITMAIFSLSLSISPGPVNILALTRGLNVGFKRAFGFVSGATFGFVSLLSLIGLGLGEVSSSYPHFMVLLKYLGCTYLFYIAYNVFKTKQISFKDRNVMKDHTPSFIQGWLMQWVNPKAWVACIAGCTLFNVYDSSERLILFLTIYFVFCYFGIACWALLGNKIQTWLSSEKQVERFNQAMGTVLFLLTMSLLFT